MLYSEFRKLNEWNRFAVKYLCVIRDIIEVKFSTYKIQCQMVEHATSRERVTYLSLQTLLRYVKSKQIYVVNPELLSTIIAENVSYTDLKARNEEVGALNVPSYTIMGYDSTAIDCVKVQSNNRKGANNATISMYIGFIINQINKYNLHITNIEMLQKFKCFGVKDTEKVVSREITVDFVNDYEFTDTYLFRVPEKLTESELKEILQEAVDIWSIAYNPDYKGKPIPAKKAEAAKKALDLGYGPYAFVDYIHACYGWSYRKNDESDFKIYYTE